MQVIGAGIGNDNRIDKCSGEKAIPKVNDIYAIYSPSDWRRLFPSHLRLKRKQLSAFWYFLRIFGMFWIDIGSIKLILRIILRTALNKKWTSEFAERLSRLHKKLILYFVTLIY